MSNVGQTCSSSCETELRDKAGGNPSAGLFTELQFRLVHVIGILALNHSLTHSLGAEYPLENVSPLRIPTKNSS